MMPAVPTSTSSRRSLKRVRHVTVVIIIAGVLGCGGGGDVGAPATQVAQANVLSTISVALSRASLEVGQVATATASGFDQHGSATAVGGLAWSSSKPEVATVVSATGSITAVGSGTTVIT